MRKNSLAPSIVHEYHDGSVSSKYHDGSVSSKYHDGSVSSKVVRHDGTVLVDGLLSAE